DASAIAKGGALSLINNSILGAMSFENASRADLRLEFGQATYADKLQMACAMRDFLLRIGDIVPHAQVAYVFVHHGEQCQKLTHHGTLDLLANELFGQLPERQCMSDNGPAQPYLGNMMFTENLTNIGCVWRENYHHVAQLITRSAGTLLVLNLVVQHLGGLQDLFPKADGNGGMYPPMLQCSAMSVFCGA
ncbi:hypothetical protein LPJ61_001976, partial [Coemansia biformis]